MQNIHIEEHHPGINQAFEELNKVWLRKFFKIEPIDEYVLTQPDDAIINKGGSILGAVLDNQIVGVVALRKVDEDIYEFTKMAVDEAHHRKGIAESLSHAAFSKARSLGGKKVILYSHTSLHSAISLYRKLGFSETPLDAGNEYQRSDIKMEIDI
jgi:ribosomal protein S18 acetylase RimI-like enzyme